MRPETLYPPAPSCISNSSGQVVKYGEVWWSRRYAPRDVNYHHSTSLHTAPVQRTSEQPPERDGRKRPRLWISESIIIATHLWESTTKKIRWMNKHTKNKNPLSETKTNGLASDLCASRQSDKSVAFVAFFSQSKPWLVYKINKLIEITGKLDETKKWQTSDTNERHT